jgi:hypothetical protein
MWKGRSQISSRFERTDPQECFVVYDIYIYIYIHTHMLICTMCVSSKKKVKKYSYPRNRPWRPIGLWDVKNSALSKAISMAVRPSALRTSRDLLPRNINFLFLEITSVTGWVHPMALYGMNDYVNWTFIHYKGLGTRDLPVGIIQPYPLRYRAPQSVCVCVCVFVF